MKNSRNQNGVTLIELMIVVAIVGILSSIAVYTFGGATEKARRSDATTALLRMAENQEKFYSASNSYNYTADETQIGGASTNEGYYILSSTTPADGTSFTLTATAVTGGAQANDTLCSVVTLNSAGQKAPVECW